MRDRGSVLEAGHAREVLAASSEMREPDRASRRTLDQLHRRGGARIHLDHVRDSTARHEIDAADATQRELARDDRRERARVREQLRMVRLENASAVRKPARAKCRITRDL